MGSAGAQFSGQTNPREERPASSPDGQPTQQADHTTAISSRVVGVHGRGIAGTNARIALAILALALGLTAASPAHAAAKPAARTSLAVRVSGLPPGTPARVVVSGPHLRRILSGSRIFAQVRPGRYTLTTSNVRIVARRGRLKAGSLALPAKRRVVVVVKPRHTAVAKVGYGTIINSNVRLLLLAPVSLRGDPTNPTSIVLPLASHVRAGSILNRATDEEAAGRPLSPRQVGPSLWIAPRREPDPS